MAKLRRTTRANSTGTLIFGIVFTVIGGALLLERMIGRPVWDYLWSFWPLLLVVMGAKILFDYRTGSSRGKE